MPYYVVRQGDHLARIAYRFGASPDDIWNARQNERLKALRGDGHILAPGDLLFVPRRRETPPSDLAVGSANAFTAEVPKTRVEMTLKLGDEPLKNEAFRVIEAPSASGQTDANGKLSFEVPVTLRRARLHLTGKGLVLPLVIGGLDPLHEVTGAQTRLLHLGHYHGPVDGRLSSATQAGLRSFQRAQGLVPSGVLDASTLDALREAYGS
ncbi:MAG: peptidoglycan-binding protein [Minicystis sp.]